MVRPRCECLLRLAELRVAYGQGRFAALDVFFEARGTLGDALRRGGVGGLAGSKDLLALSERTLLFRKRGGPLLNPAESAGETALPPL